MLLKQNEDRDRNNIRGTTLDENVQGRYGTL